MWWFPGGARYGGNLSQDIGPWSNIEPDGCWVTVAKMRWILRIQTQGRS